MWLLCPTLEGLLKETQNPLISTGDPLAIGERRSLFKMPPQEIDAPNYVFFDFVATNFEVYRACAKDRLCCEKLCDSQDCGQSACIATKPNTHWSLMFTVTCDQLSERVTGEEYVTFTSMNFTKLFVSSSKYTEF